MNINESTLTEWLTNTLPDLARTKVDDLVKGVRWEEHTPNIELHNDPNGTMRYDTSSCSVHVRHDGKWLEVVSSLNGVQPDPRIQSHLI